MEFLFSFETLEEMKELNAVIKAEAEKHFSDNWKLYMISDNSLCVVVDNNTYFEDLKKAKQNFYESRNNIINNYEKTNGDTNICLDTYGLYMKDFISEVEENLSFVSNIEVL